VVHRDRVLESDFFDERKEWSRWKHEMLRRYLPKFAGIIGWTHRLIHYVDGFAGAGTYGDPPVAGSPLIAAELAEQAAAR
jgi:three-Cys-motif partner protein